MLSDAESESETAIGNSTLSIQKANELLKVAKNTGKKKKTKGAADESDNDNTDVYHEAGKKAVVLLDPFTNPLCALSTGIEHETERTDDALSPEVLKRRLHFYNGIFKLILGLRDDLGKMSSDKFKKMAAMIAKGMSDGRSNDIASVKQKGLNYMLKDMHRSLKPTILEGDEKSTTRGIYHPQLGRFLCPRRDLDDYDEDPDRMEALQSGEICIKASRWPSGFYEEGVYDPDDKTAGLFRNHTVVRFYKHLFLGPSSVSATGTRRVARPSKNRAWGLHAVDRYMIAYTYFTLSHAKTWTHTIGDMNLEDLYWRIIEMLEDEKDEWVVDTLEWWNHHCNPTGVKSTASTGKKVLDDDDSEDDMAQVCARRAAGASGSTATQLTRKTTGKTPGRTAQTAKTAVDNSKNPSDLDASPATATTTTRNELAMRVPTPQREPSDLESIYGEEDRPSLEVHTALRVSTTVRKDPERTHTSGFPAKFKGQAEQYMAHMKSAAHLFDEDNEHPSTHTENAATQHGPGSAMGPASGSAMGPGSAMRSSRAESPLSQFSDKNDNETQAIRPVTTKVGTKRVRLTLPATTDVTNNNDTSAPPPKKAKKPSTRPETAPLKRNPARGKRVNGF